jgi:hypothetical protein
MTWKSTNQRVAEKVHTFMVDASTCDAQQP